MSKRWTTEYIENIMNKVVTGLPDDYVIDGVEITTKRKNNKHEQKLQIQIATYMKLKHPEIIFYSDVASGCKLTIGQSVLNKRMQYSRSLPDMFIAHANSHKSGLFLELKRAKEEIYKKDGTLRKDQHIEEQANMLNELTKRGYAAHFACGFDEAVNIIENYCKDKVMKNNMKNIKDEFLKDVIYTNSSGLISARINYHRFDNINGDRDAEFELKKYHSNIEYERFLHCIDFEYDDSEKSKDNVSGTAIMRDGTMFTKSTFKNNKSWVNFINTWEV